MKIKDRKLKWKYGVFALLTCVIFVGLLYGMILSIESIFIKENYFSLYGDLNHDEIIDYRDGDRMCQLLKEIDSGVENSKQADLIDFNGDSVIDIMDALYYYAYYESEDFERILFEDFVNKVNRKEVRFYE